MSDRDPENLIAEIEAHRENEAREREQAWRDLGNALLDAFRIPQLTDWLNRKLTRMERR